MPSAICTFCTATGACASLTPAKIKNTDNPHSDFAIPYPFEKARIVLRSSPAKRISIISIELLDAEEGKRYFSNIRSLTLSLFRRTSVSGSALPVSGDSLELQNQSGKISSLNPGAQYE